MAWTYLLECRDGSYYVGSTVDLAARLHQHQIGEGAAYTRPRRRRPVRLLWSGEFETAPEAFAFEKQLQGWSRAKREALARGDFAALPDLASRPTARTPPDDD
ncbi:GIY-YIG nuclease family protein [Nocardioides aequoreus]|uniref:GIY-YIG nuclease family protein n=1 Tax=Nocardioides aequoreus TaxID=397278 RepID=UPI0004C445C7|nr:GIY-YIG nuclease family protein [Nocardioides aequoreus]